MKFQFPFNGVMKQRAIVQKDAQKDYLEAQGRVEDCLREIDRIYKTIDQSRKEVSELQKSDDSNQSAGLQLIDQSIEGLRVRIERLRKTARELLMIAEEKREILLEATKELKVIETYKEKKWQQFKTEKKKADAKKVDEIVTMRFLRGAK